MIAAMGEVWMSAILAVSLVLNGFAAGMGMMALITRKQFRDSVENTLQRFYEWPKSSEEKQDG